MVDGERMGSVRYDEGHGDYHAKSVGERYAKRGQRSARLGQGDIRNKSELLGEYLTG